jgi:hypothetical protein
MDLVHRGPLTHSIALLESCPVSSPLVSQSWKARMDIRLQRGGSGPAISSGTFSSKRPVMVL